MIYFFGQYVEIRKFQNISNNCDHNLFSFHSKIITINRPKKNLLSKIVFVNFFNKIYFWHWFPMFFIALSYLQFHLRLINFLLFWDSTHPNDSRFIWRHKLVKSPDVDWKRLGWIFYGITYSQSIFHLINLFSHTTHSNVLRQILPARHHMKIYYHLIRF